MRAGISWDKQDNKLERPAYLQPNSNYVRLRKTRDPRLGTRDLFRDDL